jgi:thiosulfate dehydrogenase [quinone] large subunit
MKLQNIQICILRLALGALLLHAGYDKWSSGWLQSSQELSENLASYHEHATGVQLRYLDTVAIPYAGVWSKLMTVGEAAVGISLLLGLLVRLGSLVGIFMVVNFHIANGNMFSVNVIGSPWAALLLAGLLVTLLAGAGRWFGIDAVLAKRSPTSFLW